MRFRGTIVAVIDSGGYWLWVVSISARGDCGHTVAINEVVSVESSVWVCRCSDELANWLSDVTCCHRMSHAVSSLIERSADLRANYCNYH